MDSKLLVGLIKEVVKNEVKQQVKEELAKLIKSGAVTLNKERKQSSVLQMTEVKKQPVQQKPQQIKEYTKNPMLNEVLSQTQPFTSQQRAEGGMMDESSVLDMIQPERYEEDGWETMDYRTQSAPQQIPSNDNAGLNALQRALNRDYSDLTKVFTKQEKQKGLR
jgi:hypothetical protein